MTDSYANKGYLKNEIALKLLCIKMCTTAQQDSDRSFHLAVQLP